MTAVAPPAPVSAGTPSLDVEAGGVEAGGVEARAMTALLACLGRFGVAKTNLDDVAREAGCSRATLYRYFDGKDALLARTVAAEQARVVGLAVATAQAEATFTDAAVTVVVTVAGELGRHEPLQFLLAHEPGVVLGHLAFGPGDRLLLRVSEALAPAFGPWLDADGAARAADWVVRLLRSYVLMPDPPVDLADAGAARAFLEQFVIPGLEGR